MKIDRLVGILAILLQQDIVTAPELAAHFEVSRRTINRDIDSLCKAGIPIYTKQGVGGGISIMEDYKIDRTLLSSRDMREILAGLRGLDSISGGNHYGQLMEKLCVGSSNFVSGRDTIFIDLSSWYKDSLAPKIERIQSAIETRHLLSFAYYAPKGDSDRVIEPYFLIFQWSSWYVWGWCLERKDFRMFKLNRMDQLKMLEQGFQGRSVPIPDCSNEKIFPDGIHVRALFTPDVKWRLIEEFGPQCFEEMEDGKLLFTADYTGAENLICWLLTFGAKVKVLEPVEVRSELQNIAKSILKEYEE